MQSRRFRWDFDSVRFRFDEISIRWNCNLAPTRLTFFSPAPSQPNPTHHPFSLLALFSLFYSNCNQFSRDAHIMQRPIKFTSVWNKNEHFPTQTFCFKFLIFLFLRRRFPPSNTSADANKNFLLLASRDTSIYTLSNDTRFTLSPSSSMSLLTETCAILGADSYVEFKVMKLRECAVDKWFASCVQFVAAAVNESRPATRVRSLKQIKCTCRHSPTIRSPFTS